MKKAQDKKVEKKKKKVKKIIEKSPREKMVFDVPRIKLKKTNAETALMNALDSYELSHDDFFKPQSKTILTNPIAALKTCQSLIDNLKKRIKYIDNEFGPLSKEDTASDSLYFSSDDIPSGCPNPQHVKWYRP